MQISIIDDLPHDVAHEFLSRDTAHNLAILGALLFEPVEAVYGLQRAAGCAAVGLVVAGEANIPDALPTVMLDAVDSESFLALLEEGMWPSSATWVAHRREFLPLLERYLGRTHTPGQGMVYLGTCAAPPALPVAARLLTRDDSALDLTPCSLSAIALSYWMIRGWRVYGVVEGGQLIGHAVASYPIDDTEEVSAVFTAPDARRRGVARACAAAAARDICAKGKQAIYVSRQNNHASLAVARSLGMQPLFETWEIEVRKRQG